MWQFLLIFGISIGLSLTQTIDDDMFYFTNPSQGNAVWILDESSLPWTGGYQFLRSLSGNPTILLSVVDSSTGVTLGQCVAPHDGNHTQRWQKFQWQLTSSGLECRFDSPQPINVQFAPSANPRTFSVRIQSATGPACLREMTVQNEQPVGCPPHLSRNSFTAISLNCSCPYLEAATNEDSDIENEDGDMLANTPQFPIFKGIENEPSAPTTQWTLSPSPCASHECLNNGTCLVAQDGKPTCLCRNGFSGERCESDVCSSVPCQNGGVCRSNSGIAYCECPPAFTGLLCESSSEEAESETATPKCTPECSNGQCLLKNGQPECECRQGFTGANCNVLDVCLGDAACSMFGPNAKCVLDENMDKMASATLINGTYDCLCPHPVHGQFVECMQLHAPTAVATPSFPVLEISKLPIGQTTETTPVVTVKTTQQQSVQTEGQTVGFTVTREPMRPVEITLSTTLPPPFQQHIITAGENVMTSQQPVEHKVPTQTTFIFPQTPETTTAVFETTSEEEEVTTQETPRVKFVSPVVPDAAEEEEEEEEMTEEETSETFPTPSTMTTDEESTSQEVSSTTSVLTTTEEEEEESEETVPSTLPTTTQTTTQSTTTTTIPTTSTSTTEEPTTTEMEETTTEEEEEMEIETTKTSLPFWMTSSTTKEPTPPPTQMPDDGEEEEIESATENVINPEVEESAEEMTTASNEETVSQNKNAAEVTTPSDITHQQTHNGKQTSAAASWIIAIIALIVLGLLLLATSLFILRYIRQSRKLHGKYNPAREEHNLSAAYAMPMSHIAKEERLI